MTIHTCKKCDFTTIHKYLYDKHILINKHTINTNHTNIDNKCVYCNIKSKQYSDYKKHLLTKKHINNFNAYQNTSHIDISNNIIDKIDTIALNQITLSKQNEEVKKQNEEVLKQNEELKQKIEQLERVNNQNTNKIVKEARAIKKSILTLLNANFKDTPSIAYINEEQFRLELEEEYKRKISDTNDEIFIRIFNDYKNNKLIKTLADLILKFVKKEDQKNQSVFDDHLNKKI
jgi:hypothetical protein